MWGIKKTKYLKKVYQKPVIKKNILNKNFSNRFIQSSSKKIIITAMRYFETFYDQYGEYVAGKSTIIITNIDKKYKLDALNILLNSNFISKYINENYSSLGIDGGVNFNKDLINDLPLPNDFLKYQKRLSEYHNLLLKKLKLNEDICKLNNEINQYVRKIYNINNENF